MAISSVGSNARPGVCTSTTRPTAPFEGQLIYETDTNRLVIYDGSSWVFPNTPAQNPTGLEFITSTTQTTGTEMIFDGVFTNTYRHYRILWNGEFSSNGSNLIRLRNGGVDRSNTEYVQTGINIDGSQASPSMLGNNTKRDAVDFTWSGGTTSFSYAIVDIFNPRASTRTIWHFNTGFEWTSGLFYWRAGTAYFDRDDVCDGFRVYSGPNMNGTISVYGYRN